MHNYLEQFDAVIFDMDGTLVDSMPAHMDSWRMAGEVHGYPYDAQWHYSLGGISTEGTAKLIIERYGLDVAPEAIAHTKRETWEAMEKEPVLFEETYDLFQKLLGVKPLAVGTGSDRQHAKEVLGKVGLIEKLDALVTACDVVNGKPHPDTFATAAERMGIAPEKCVVFEDTEIGRQAALSAGMACVLVVDGKIQWPD